ncbi:transcription elongation factor TFIIS-like [Mangifera indica]|uniref:transcription elongation factor TFIIS-like n=1 Tax=Mangifera indica TaxID=29780 RepID=UPI001CFB2E6F|nr:transcription elongation factor TFIIS-like [Mangifera indica]
MDKHLRHLKQHKKEKIRLMAEWLLEIWSKKIKDYSSKTKGKFLYVESSEKTQQSDKSTTSAICHQHSSIGSTKLEETGHGKTTSEGSIGSRQFEEAGKNPQKFILKIKMKQSKESCKFEALFKCKDASRVKVREILLVALQKVASEVDGETKQRVNACDPIGVAVLIETEMLKQMGPYNGPKKLKYRSVLFNMNDPNNPDLRRKILLGEVKPERLIQMSSEEMTSDEREIKRIKDKATLGEQTADKKSEEKPDFDEGRWLESFVDLKL